MGFINVDGGNVVQPANLSYLAISLTAPITLQWPSALTGSADIVANIMNVTSAAGGPYTISLADATQATPGQQLIFNNVGAYSFTILNSEGNTLYVIAPNEVILIYLTANTDMDGTPNPGGTWSAFTYGTGTSSADASALAGKGLNALTGVLNTNYPVVTKSSNYVVLTTDRASVIIWTGGAGTITLPAVATVTNGFNISINNSGTGSVGVTTADSSQINGVAPPFSIPPGGSCQFVSSATAYYTVGYNNIIAFNATYTNVSCVAGGTITLSAAQYQRSILNFTGAIPSNTIIVIPATPNQYYVFNNTTNGSGYTFTIKPSGGTGLVVAQGAKVNMVTDGTTAFSIPS